MKKIISAALLFLVLSVPVKAEITVSVTTCKHHAEFQKFLDSIPNEYTHYGNQHWTTIEYTEKLWPYACKVFKAAGDPKTFTGVTFPERKIILVEDVASTPVLGTFIHETGHAVLWPAISNITFSEYASSIDAVYQHEFDVLGRDDVHTDEEVQENWCEELRHYSTPNDTTVTAWEKTYFNQLFSKTGPFPPTMPVPDNYITPPTDEIPPESSP